MTLDILSMTIEKITCTCSMMPNQFEGIVNGRPFYFRARHGSWALHIGIGPGGDAVDGPVVAEGAGELLGEYHEEPGWWTKEDAEKFVRELLDKHAP